MQTSDVLIIGSGVAALQLASSLCEDLNVIVLTKSHLTHSNSSIAQGGIAASIGVNDDPGQHLTDTLEAGRYINNVNAVKRLTAEAPAIIHDLLRRGCQFDQDNDGSPLLGMEGSHSQQRIIHGGGDQTGKRIVDCLKNQINTNLTLIEDLFVYDLLVDRQDHHCYGAKGKDKDGKIHTFVANHVVLSTGGCGQIYSHTSNASSVTGDGLALAYRAGAELTDMEFVQFHPTLLYINGEAKGLVSEAVRGEGAKLVTSKGARVMEGVHPLGDLAPRHIVSQTIFDAIQKGSEVYLDIQPIRNFSTRFPTITKLCESNGISIQDGKIPVAPGCHFLMGGIKTDEVGRTNIKGLYAIGEVASTGVHGANRLASNSLLEGLVFGKRLATHLNSATDFSNWKLPYEQEKSITPTILHLPPMATLQSAMMKRTGIVRTKEGLEQQVKWLESFHIQELISIDYDRLSIEHLTLLFMTVTSWLIATSALQRTESRGGHFRSDIPVEKQEWVTKHIVLQRQNQKGDRYEYHKATATT